MSRWIDTEVSYDLVRTRLDVVPGCDELSLDRAIGDLVDSSMITELRTDTFHHWLEIAAEASANAETARTIAIEPGRDDNDTFTADSSVSFERR